MNTDKERLKIALKILEEDLLHHKDWQDYEANWNAVLKKLSAIQTFVNKMD
jgi:hypothetical protein